MWCRSKAKSLILHLSHDLYPPPPAGAAPTVCLLCVWKEKRLNQTPEVFHVAEGRAEHDQSKEQRVILKPDLKMASLVRCFLFRTSGSYQQKVLKYAYYVENKALFRL